jgi:c-di-GMP-binding flagellar brake protein YcgR
MNNRPTLPELRKNARVSLAIDYRLVIDGQVFVGQTGNVSLGGVSLSTCEPLLSSEYAGRSGSILLDLDENPFESECRIVYVGNPNVARMALAGINFTGLSQEGRELLLKYIVHHL